MNDNLDKLNVAFMDIYKETKSLLIQSEAGEIANKVQMVGNSSNLRATTLVPELREKINTQISEQLFNEMDKDAYFLDTMTPEKHIIKL